MGPPADRQSNNFDLIRLAAAMQVLLGHAFQYLGFDQTRGLCWLIELFPGVPIFFVISGYLIAQSYDRSASVSDFALRRFTRIYPAMWGALGFSAVIVALLHPVSAVTFATWLLAQATIAQNWHPDALRNFGVGVVNGPLWSVCVEIALYTAVPLIARLRSAWLLGIAAASFAALYSGHAYLRGFSFTLAYVTPLMWAGMFLTGTLLYRARVKPPLSVCALAWAIVLALSVAMPNAPEFVLRATGNQLGILNFIALTGLIFALAFARPISLAGDISYGMYLYHMPVMNVVIALGLTGAMGLTLTLAATGALALASWCLIERPCLEHLRHRRRAAEHVPSAVGENEIGGVAYVVEGDRAGRTGKVAWR